MFSEIFEGQYYHLLPYEIYLDYLSNANIVRFAPDGEGLALCAPDKGARDFVREMIAKLNLPKAKCLLLDKERTGERDVEISLSKDSESTFDDVAGHDIVLFDDMVRTGSTLVKTCQYLKKIQPGRLVFAVTHFYASDEGRQKLADTAIDEILTLNTLPTILNRDEQGRLRRKIVVLKIERWLAHNLTEILGLPRGDRSDLYHIDMSSKNPRFTRKISSNVQLRDLRDERRGSV
jgi:ribose-phosphate pyrophosphokinase